VNLSQLRDQGLRITLEGDRIKAGPSTLLTAELTNAIREGKAALLAELRREHIEDVQEFMEERAAIAEFDGNMPRPEAERLAIERTAIRFSLRETYGPHHQPGGGFLLGQPGDTAKTLIESLQARYGNRLESVFEN
jgi:hypothetical protein